MIKIFKIIIILFIVFFLGIYLSSYYYQRSFLASVAEIYLKVINYDNVTEKQMEEWLKDRAKMEDIVYELPKGYDDVLIENKFEMQTLYLNNNGKGNKVLYLHGGSYLHHLDPNHLKFLYKIIEKTDVRVVIPIYPKAPQHGFLEAYEKVINLYKEISKEDNIILMGDSAGGGFILGLAQEIKKLSLKNPKKLIAISPWVDLSMENPEIKIYQKVDPWLKFSKALPTARAWAKGTDLKDSRLSPIYGDLTALNDLTIFIGNRDLLYPDTKLLSEKLTLNNIKHELIIGNNLNHVYPLFPIPEAKEAIDKISEILQ